MASTYSNLQAFLYDKKSIKGSTFTHTCMKGGSYYLPPCDLDEFHNLYIKDLLNNKDLHITEKHREISPVLIDFDFRFEQKYTERKYTNEMIDKVVDLYINEIGQYIELPKKVQVYVMEKSAPRLDKSLIKDGIHIMIPNIVTRPSVQLIVRENLLKQFGEIFEPMNCCNTIEDIYDECVIDKNNWLMAGSKKTNNEAYQTPYIAGGFIFAPSDYLTEVSYDPNLPYLFVGEEILHSLRAYTFGWDVFTPTENIVFHEYTRASKPKIWTDNPYYSDTAAFDKAKYYLGIIKDKNGLKDEVKVNLDKYGLGKSRTLKDFFKYTGVDIDKKTVNTNFCRPDNKATEEDIKQSNEKNHVKENFILFKNSDYTIGEQIGITAGIIFSVIFLIILFNYLKNKIKITI